MTYAKLLRTKSGESRKMAFVGFQAKAKVRAALAVFNQTFLNASRLGLEGGRPCHGWG